MARNIAQSKTALELIESFPEFFEETPTEEYYWNQVRTQAARHLWRLQRNALFDIGRPNETPEIKNFRDNVRRDITISSTWKWLMMISRVFIENGIELNPQTISPDLAEWLDSNPFAVNGRSFGFSQYRYEVILPAMVVDPNGLLVPWPVVSLGSIVPPAMPVDVGGLPANEQVKIESQIISSSRILVKTHSLVAYYMGEWIIDDERQVLKSYYVIIDKDGFYLYIPVATSDGKIRYDLIPWYIHNEGVLMAASMTGIVTNFVQYNDNIGQEERMSYYESFLRPMFEIGDEVVMAFSDDQATRSQYVTPKLVMDQIPCVNPDCRGGNVQLFGADGGVSGIETCGSCRGTSYMPNPGPYNVIIRDNSNLGETSSKPTLEYVTPPSDNIKHIYDVPWDLLAKANMSVGMDLVEDLQESGIAKEHRLEPRKDIITRVANSFFDVVESHIGHVSILLTVNEGARLTPAFTMPSNIQHLSSDILKENAETALPSDRFQATMEYYRKKYIGDDVLLKVYELTLLWAPITLIPESEIKTNLAWGGLYCCRSH